ncbi:MAG TPA: toll/interleukin-1 receptor domain-containing protein [Terracidiphilus sp.]|jgi:hypothetical protein
MGRAIFISYRRDDTEGEAGRLFDDLTRSFDDQSVFMDVSGINPGVDFRRAIDDNVASCGVLLAIIGPTWATIAGSTGARRLDDSNDFVRLEIASALRRDVAVIPVLVHDAKMPHPDDLPEDLKELAFRNSVELTHARWNSDVKLLTDALRPYVAPTAATDTAPVHATVSVQLPAPTASVSHQDPARRSSLPLILTVIVACVLALGFVGYWILRPNPVDRNLSVPVQPIQKDNPPTEGVSSFIGTWAPPAPESHIALLRLQIAANNDSASIHAWGKCDSGECDWGTVSGVLKGDTLTGDIKLDGRVLSLSLQSVSNGMRVSITNTFTDGRVNHAQLTFVKTP